MEFNGEFGFFGTVSNRINREAFGVNIFYSFLQKMEGIVSKGQFLAQWVLMDLPSVTCPKVYKLQEKQFAGKDGILFHFYG